MDKIVTSKKIWTKKIIDLFVDFLRENVSKNKVYQTTKVSDRFSYETAQIPCVIIRNTSNTVRRTDFTDFLLDVQSRVQLIPISTDNNIVGSNFERVNIPSHVEQNTLWPWDPTVGIPSGTDINKTLYTSISGNYNVNDVTTGIIITIPSASTFIPQSIERAEEINNFDYYSQQQLASTITSGNTYDLVIGLSNAQYYMLYSGSSFSGSYICPIYQEQILNNPSGMSGVSIYFNDLLYPGDRYQIRTFEDETYVCERYGGMIDHTINFDVYGMSTIETQELCDIIERFLVEKKYELWDRVGFTAKSWSKGGESEQPHLNEYIFKANITTDGILEWHEDKGIQVISGMTIYSFPAGSYVTVIPVVGEEHVQTTTLSGNIFSPLIFGAPYQNILNVYSSGASIIYPSASGVSSSGSGFFSFSGNIGWTNGNYPDYSIPIASGFVPSGNSTYYIDYTYQGIKFVQSVIPT